MTASSSSATSDEGGDNNNSVKVAGRKRPPCLSRMVVLRLIFVASLIVAAAVCGFVSYTVIGGLEESVAVQTYESVATSALDGAQAITARKVQGGKVMASILSYAFPNASEWPFIYLDGYSETSGEIAELASSTSLALIVLVDPGEVTEFEQFALDTYNENGFSEKAGRSDFGFGVYRVDHNITGQNIPSEYEDGRSHDTSGVNPWGGKHNILAPIYLHNIKNAKSLMFNVYSEKFRTTVLDSMFECAAKANETRSKPDCSVVTDWVKIIVKPGPASVLYQPIFPRGDNNTMVAFTGTSIHWSEVLTNIVPDYVDGLYCVISSDTGTTSYTYDLRHGVPELLGSGDLHDPDYEEYGHSVILNNITTRSSASAKYTLTVYPSDVMFQEFATNSPLAVAMGFVGVILLCTAIFFLYDFVVKREAHQRKMILEMKRRFVRYISHEIRTPLNIVCMGLDLLQRELGAVIDKKKKEGVEEQEKERVECAPPECVVPDHDDEKKNDNSETKQTVPEGIPETYWLDLCGDCLENSQNAVSILNDVLNYDKIESNTFKLEVAAVDIWKLIRRTTAEFKIQAQNRKVYLNLVMDTPIEEDKEEEEGRKVDLDELNVLGDEIRLTQVLRNLISNALKFTDHGGDITVKATYNPDGLPEAKPFDDDTKQPEAAALAVSEPRSGSIVVTVKDSGVGLTNEQLGRLFTEGLQFDKNKLQAGGGSGLGLCITKEIILQHGATIEATSEGHGMGTTFIIEMPLFRGLISKEASDKNLELGGTAETQRTRDCSTGSTPPLTQHHILVVDDVIINTKMMTRLLERAGHTCEVAHNGKQAIEKYRANRDDSNATQFDTILMDYEMPVMKGPDATEKLREEGCKISIVGVTGNVLAEDVSHFKSKGANHVLLKPVNLGRLDAYWKSLQ